MMNGSNYSLSDIAAATGSNNRANDMWGGDGFSLIWLVLIFAIFGWGGFGGWGGGFGGNGANGAGFQGWATRADINESFALNDIQQYGTQPRADFFPLLIRINAFRVIEIFSSHSAFQCTGSRIPDATGCIDYTS